MAKTFENSILLSEVMTTPDFEVDYAVGTTYNLDLEYLFGLTAFMGLLGNVDELLRKSPIFLLESVQRSKDRFMVFCNASNISASNIKVSRPELKLYSIIEDDIKPLCLSRNVNNVVSFHPKVWVIQETSKVDGHKQIKVMVMSRNMGQSTCLDVACTMIGRVEGEYQHNEKQKPLCDFLKWLKENARCSDYQVTKVDMMIDNLKRVGTFDLKLDDESESKRLFGDYQFFPMGIDGYAGENCLEEFKGAGRALIMSPFIDETILSNFEKCKNRLLIARKEWVSEEIFNQFERSDGVWIAREELLDNEDISSDIHAKMYHITKGGQHHIYLGSANATRKAFEQNVEFMLKLTYNGRSENYVDMKEGLMVSEKSIKENANKPKQDREEGLFYRMAQIDVGEVQQVDSDRAIREAVIVLQGAIAEVKEDGKGYRIEMTMNGMEIDAMISPLLRPDLKQRLSERNVFEGMELIDLSCLYQVEVDGMRRIVKIETNGIPENRDEEIKKRIIDTPEKFVEYLGFLLGDMSETYVVTMNGDVGEKRDSETNNGEGIRIAGFPLYEELLKITYLAPKRIIEIKERVEGLGKEVIPEGFGEMMDVFEKTALNMIKK